MTYILINYENVNNANLGVLVDRPFDVMVFVGANQTKVPIDLANGDGEAHVRGLLYAFPAMAPTRSTCTSRSTSGG